MTNGVVGKFLPAADIVETFAEWCEQYRELGLKPQTLRRLYDQQRADALYLSDQYQVAINKRVKHGFAGQLIWWLSIKRIDKEPIMDWRDLMAIKNQLCGAEAEAMQIFPAMSRCVDTSNQYHLWVWMKGPSGKFPKIPIGWFERMMTDSPGGNAKQRPWAEPKTQKAPDPDQGPGAVAKDRTQ